MHPMFPFYFSVKCASFRINSVRLLLWCVPFTRENRRHRRIRIFSRSRFSASDDIIAEQSEPSSNIGLPDPPFRNDDHTDLDYGISVISVGATRHEAAVFRVLIHRSARRFGMDCFKSHPCLWTVLHNFF